jgi:hypothetical protein
MDMAKKTKKEKGEKKELQRGDVFNMYGYEMMAGLDAMDGEKIFVVSNNSTHFLVAKQSQSEY